MHYKYILIVISGFIISNEESKIDWIELSFFVHENPSDVNEYMGIQCDDVSEIIVFSNFQPIWILKNSKK